MESYAKDYVQYFARRKIKRVFSENNRPQLLYASYVDSKFSGYPRVMHSHNNSAELILICRGNADFLIGHRSHSIKTGDLIVYNAGVVHDELTSMHNPVSLWCIGLGGLQLPGLAPNCLVREGEQMIFETGEDYGDLYFLFEMIFNALCSGLEEEEEAAQQLTGALLIRLMRIIREAQKDTPPEVSAKARARKAGFSEDPLTAGMSDANILGMRVKRYIDEHYWESVTLDLLSKTMNCSKYYISHAFKDLCGYSPMNYLIRRRIGEAQNLLIGTDLPIAEITWQLGYDTQSYFTSQFTKIVGMTPMTYRKRYVHHPENKPAKPVRLPRE